MHLNFSKACVFLHKLTFVFVIVFPADFRRRWIRIAVRIFNI